MRSIHELLLILKSNMITYFGPYNDGMCLVVPYLRILGEITREEKNLVLKYIRENRPINIWRGKRSNYYWKPGRLTPRMKWLDEHIKLTSEDYKRRHAIPFG